MAASKEAQFFEEFSENFLVCPICSERYKNAKVLPCQHSFCEQCLRDLVEKTGKLECPICRRSCQLPVGGVGNLQTNFSVNQMVEEFDKRQPELAETRKCDICERDDSVKHCVECDLNLCENCATAHGKVPVTRSHNLMAFDEYQEAKAKTPAIVQPPTYCSKHPESQVKYYCDSCSTVICTDCTVIDHPITSHKYRYLNEAAGEFSKSLSKMIDNLVKKEKENLGSKTAVDKVSETLEQTMHEETNRIKNHAQKEIEEFTRKVVAKEQQLLKELDEVYVERKGHLQAQMQDLESVGNNLERVRGFAENLIQNGNATQLLTARQGMTAQIQELMTVETECSPVADGYMEFLPSNETWEVKSLGMIQKRAYSVSKDSQFTRVGDEVKATVKVASRKVQPAPASSRDVKATMKTPDNKTETMKVTDNKDGTVSLRSVPKVEGKHELSVSVYNTPVQGSPLRVNVIPRKGLRCRFGREGSGKGGLNYPVGVMITKKKDVLVCDKSNNRLRSFNLKGNHDRTVTYTNFDKDFVPHHAAASKNGRIYITDVENKQVVVCDENYKLIGWFGQDQLKRPTGIAENPTNGWVYVVDNTANCVHIYGADHQYIKSFGSWGNGNGQFQGPFCVCITPSGNVIVSDCSNHRIQVFTAEGEHLHTFGSCGSGVYEFNSPHGVTTDKAGNLYVCDGDNYRVQKFDSQYRYVCRVDDDVNRVKSPIGICVTDDEPLAKVVVSEFDYHCISVFNQ